MNMQWPASNDYWNLIISYQSVVFCSSHQTVKISSLTCTVDSALFEKHVHERMMCSYMLSLDSNKRPLRLLNFSIFIWALIQDGRLKEAGAYSFSHKIWRRQKRKSLLYIQFLQNKNNVQPAARYLWKRKTIRFYFNTVFLTNTTTFE